MASSEDPEAKLLLEIAKCAKDPLRFVRFAFPWGQGELVDHQGPDEWQIACLSDIRDGLKTVQQVIHEAVASGHGVGKSALVSWIILWAMSTMPDTRGVVTANTEAQLRTKTHPELAKWHRLCICGHWFKLTATAIFSVDDDHARTWRIDFIPWSENNTEAFAGLHNQGRRIICLFDEASAIPDVIWEVAEGALTDVNTEIIWAVFGNPTKNSGRFRECFGRFRHRWLTRQVDSRTARLTNKEQIAEWIKDYGEDSDFVRVRVRGVFPRAGSMQFISSEVAESAMGEDREPTATIYDPLIMGVDVARFGDDATVIAFRRGRDARYLPWIRFNGVDTMTLAARIVQLSEQHHPDAIFVDGGGVGGGVIDRLRMLRQPVIEVQFGGKPMRAQETQEGAISNFDWAAEMWGIMKEWLKYGAIPKDNDLLADLTGREFGYATKAGRYAIQLERKQDMKKRGLASPDLADALALTFALPIQPSDHSALLQKKNVHEVEYDPMAEAYAIGAIRQRR